MLEFHGHIQQDSNTFIPQETMADKMIEDVHGWILNGGIKIIIMHIRKNYLIPKLRQLIKKVNKRCYRCYGFQLCQ